MQEKEKNFNGLIIKKDTMITELESASKQSTHEFQVEILRLKDLLA